MKKNYLLLLSVTLITISSTIAQNVLLSGKAVAGQPQSMVLHNKSIGLSERGVGTDTTGLGFKVKQNNSFYPVFPGPSNFFIYWTYTEPSSNSNYLFGNNLTGWRTYAQGYNNVNATSVKIVGAIALFWVKDHDIPSAPASSKVVIKAIAMSPSRAYNTDNSGTFNSTVKNAEGPDYGQAADSVDLLFSAIDTTDIFTTGNGNYVAFPNEPTFSGNFAIVADMTDLAAGDTVGLWADQKGDAGNLDYAFALTQDKTRWFVMDQLWSDVGPTTGFGSYGSGGLDNEIALFAVFSDATGVNEYFNGMKITAYPLPANNHTTIEYTLEKNSSNVSLAVYDLLGKEILLKEAGSQSAGTYKFNLETAHLPSGNYFYMLRANGFKITKKIVVSH